MDFDPPARFVDRDSSCDRGACPNADTHLLEQCVAALNDKPVPQSRFFDSFTQEEVVESGYLFRKRTLNGHAGGEKYGVGRDHRWDRQYFHLVFFSILPTAAGLTSTSLPTDYPPLLAPPVPPLVLSSPFPPPMLRSFVEPQQEEDGATEAPQPTQFQREFCLDGAVLVVGSPTRQDGEWRDREPCGLRLVLASGGTLWLRAKDPSARDKWASALRQVLLAAAAAKKASDQHDDETGDSSKSGLDSDSFKVDPKRYTVKRRLGRGAYGTVCLALDRRRSGAEIAIKKISNVFADAVDARRVLREVRFLRSLRHPCLLPLVDLGFGDACCDEAMQEIYLMTPAMDCALQAIIFAPPTNDKKLQDDTKEEVQREQEEKRFKKRRGVDEHGMGVESGKTEGLGDVDNSEKFPCDASSVPLSEDQREWIAYQCLAGVAHLHASGIIHRDLKPANILVDLASCNIRIADFGLSTCSLGTAPASNEDGDSDNDKGHRGGAWAGHKYETAARAETDPVGDQTMYVVTRWYRAPELLLGFENYDTAIDMWSLGCILSELYTRRPLLPGHDLLDQLERITAVVGTPSKKELWFVRNPRALEFMNRLPRVPRHLSQIFALDSGSLGVGVARSSPVAMAAKKKERAAFSRLLGAPTAALDMIRSLLVVDPKCRLDASTALTHAWVARVRIGALDTDKSGGVKGSKQVREDTRRQAAAAAAAAETTTADRPNCSDVQKFMCGPKQPSFRCNEAVEIVMPCLPNPVAFKRSSSSLSDDSCGGNMGQLNPTVSKRSSSSMSEDSCGMESGCGVSFYGSGCGGSFDEGSSGMSGVASCGASTLASSFSSVSSLSARSRSSSSGSTSTMCDMMGLATVSSFSAMPSSSQSTALSAALSEASGCTTATSPFSFSISSPRCSGCFDNAVIQPENFSNKEQLNDDDDYCVGGFSLLRAGEHVSTEIDSCCICGKDIQGNTLAPLTVLVNKDTDVPPPPQLPPRGYEDECGYESALAVLSQKTKCDGVGGDHLNLSPRRAMAALRAGVLDVEALELTSGVLRAAMFREVVNFRDEKCAARLARQFQQHLVS